MRARTIPALRLAASLLFAAHLRGEDAVVAGLDLVVLVDRSGSMASHSPAAVVDALPLALNVLARSSRYGGVRHRFGIIGFGSRAQTDVPLTLLDDTTHARLRERIAILDSGSLGNTNFVAAFVKAQEAFEALPAEARRRRAILLVTDGHFAVPGVPRDASARQLQELVESPLSGTPVTIDVLLLGAERPPPFWQQLSHGRVHHARSDRGEILATLHRIVTGLTGTRGRAHDLADSARTLILPPYLELVVFDVVRNTSSGDIPLIPPGASAPLNAQSPGVEEAHSGDVLSTVIIRRPAPGVWTLGTSDANARVKVLSQEFFPRGVLIEPSMAPAVPQHDFVTIAYSLRDGDGTALRELDGYPLTVDVSLSRPDGRRMVLPMKRGAGAVYQTTRAAECSVTGRYWTEVLVTTSDSAGQPVRVFEDRWSGFAVEPAERPATHAAAMGLRVADAAESGVIADSRHALLLYVSLVAAALVLFTMMRRR